MSKEREILLELLLLYEKFGSEAIKRALDILQNEDDRAASDLMALWTKVESRLTLSRPSARVTKASQKDREIEKLKQYLRQSGEKEFQEFANMLGLEASAANRANVYSRIEDEIRKMTISELRRFRSLSETGSVASAYSELARHIMTPKR